MTDYIDRQAAIDAIRASTSKYTGFMEMEMYTDDDAVEAIEALPSAQPEHKKGKWIKKMRVTETEKYISYDPEWYCACCGTKYDPWMAKIVNFCYVCGADMRGEQDE